MSVLRPWRPKPPGRAVFVLDLSVTLAWFDYRRATPYTVGVLSKMTSTTAIVPTAWSLQLSERLWEAEARGQEPWSRIEWFLAGLYPLYIGLDRDAPARAWSEIMTLARVHSIYVFDAAYIELARRRRLPLATIDTALTAAATAVGVPIFTP